VPTTLSFGPDLLTAILTPSQPLLGGTSYSVNLFHEMRDVADNRVRLDPFNPFQSGLGWGFTTNVAIDTTPPQVVTISPANGATGVPPNFKLRVEFSEPISTPTVTSQAVVVKKGSTILPGVFTFEQNGRVVKWAPSSPLPVNSTMTVTVTGDILDLAGNPLAVPVAGSFTTTQFQDTAPPAVTSVSPLNGATAVPTTSHVVLTFSETIDPITVTPTALSSDGFLLPGTFSLEGGAAVYPGSVSVSADRKTFTLTPTFRLFAGQTYFVRRSACCLEDLAGNALVSTIDSSFTTALAGGTDVNAQPAAATVVANSPRIFADGQATSMITISNIHRNGIAVPDGTLVAVTADRVYLLGNPFFAASGFSYGGTILGGTPSPVDSRFRLFPTQGGRVTLTYLTPRLTGTNIEQAFIQVTNTDAGSASMSLISSTGITLVTRRTAFPAANPTSVLANGTAISEITIPIEEFEFFNNGAPVASGYQFAVTAAPVFNLTSAGGTINGGTVAPDSRFKLLTTGPGGVATITYTPPAFPAAQTGTAVIQVAAVDEAGNVVGFLGSTNISLSGSTGFTSPQPVVVSASPANGQMGVATNAAVVAKFSQPLDPTTVTSSTFSITIFGSPVAGTRTLSSSEFGTNTVVTFRPTSPFASNTTFNVSITTGIKSATGNPLLTSRFTTFSTGAASDTVAPTVQQVSPPNGLTDAPRNAVVSVALSEPVSAVSVSSTTFTVSTGGVPVNGRLILSIGDGGPNSIVTFIPDQPLAPATLYTVGLGAGITDVAENPLTAFSSNFTTGASSETVQPTVLGFSPSSGQTGVPLNAQVTLQFSERINPVTIRATTFNVVGGPGPTTVAGTFVMAPDLSSASFVPSQPLLPNTQYTVTITRDIQDLAGNPLLVIVTNPTAISTSWQFTTGS